MLLRFIVPLLARGCCVPSRGRATDQEDEDTTFNF
jgi:hypothetical protein